MTALINASRINVNVADLQIDKILNSNYCFEQRMIYAVSEGTGVVVEGKDRLELYKDCVLKIEAMERLSPHLQDVCKKLAYELKHTGPVTCHLFISPEGSKSFGLHKDPDDVFLYMVKGHKGFQVGDDYVEIEVGDHLFIARGVQHQAFNYADSIMLSFGMERYIEDKF